MDANRIEQVIIGANTSALDKDLFGSVAEKVLRLSRVPVLVVKPYKESR